MRLHFEIEGMKELGNQLDRIANDPSDRIGLALIEAALRIQREAKTSIAKSPANPKTGRSFPGNPPKTDTGTLVNSIYVDVKRKKGRVTEVIVGTNLKYGQGLEFGMANIAPRPWLMPAFEATRVKNLEGLKNAAFKLVKDKGKGAA